MENVIFVNFEVEDDEIQNAINNQQQWGKMQLIILLSQARC